MKQIDVRKINVNEVNRKTKGTCRPEQAMTSSNFKAIFKRGATIDLFC